MQLKPRYQAQHYRGSGKLDGMSVLITGGDSGIGRAWPYSAHAREPMSRSPT